MDSHSLKSILIGILALYATNLQSICPEVEVWQDNHGHYRYLIPDIHKDYLDGRMSKAQQESLAKAIQQKESEGVFVLAEDLISYMGPQKKLKELYQRYYGTTLADRLAYYQKKSKIDPLKARGSMQIMELSPLTGLLNVCAQAGIRCYNIEPALSLGIYKKSLADRTPLTPGDIIDYVADMNAELASHRQLIPLAQHIKERTVSGLAKLEIGRAYDYVAMLNSHRMRDLIFDAKMKFKLIDWQNIKHGFICAGKTHIDTSKEYLKELGYHKVRSIGNADLWKYKATYAQQSPAERDKIDAVFVAHTLNLSKVFEFIFKEQEKEQKIQQERAQPAQAVSADAKAMADRPAERKIPAIQ
jgi:hypothetical protein